MESEWLPRVALEDENKVEISVEYKQIGNAENEIWSEMISKCSRTK